MTRSARGGTRSAGRHFGVVSLSIAMDIWSNVM